MEYVGETGPVSRTILKVGEEMEALRHTNPNGKFSSPFATAPPQPPQGQGLLAILVMVSVLIFILAYCCWGAPCCRSLCYRSCCCCPQDDSVAEGDSRTAVDVTQCASTPTIILLPYGRMLVVDGAVFAQFQADTTGLDLFELGESVIRAQQGQLNTPNSLLSTPSLLEIDTEVFGKRPNSPLDSRPPPTYESLFNEDDRSWRLPPSYSDTLVMAEEQSAEEQPAEQQESIV